MVKESKYKQTLKQHLSTLLKKGDIPEKFLDILTLFFESFTEAGIQGNIPEETTWEIFQRFLRLIEKSKAFLFDSYHQALTHPIDYRQFALDFIRVLIAPNSYIKGKENIQSIEAQLKQKHNVVLFANHQTEPDPPAILILLEKEYPRLASSLIFVAGERVLTDPLAIPFSMGCNLLCIYSKRYIDHPPEDKLKKQLHNKKTMEKMSQLFNEGGKCIYVAPSGGRDRKNKQGSVEVAPFDPKSIEMFYFMAKRAKQPTHFYPLALNTYNILPPPEGIQKELGETRIAYHSTIALSFCKELDMEHFPGSEVTLDKHERRKKRSDYIWECVIQAYQNLIQLGEGHA